MEAPTTHMEAIMLLSLVVVIEIVCPAELGFRTKLVAPMIGGD